MQYNRIHQAQSHTMLRRWHSLRSDVNHHADFVLPMFIIDGTPDEHREEPVGDSMPGISRYSPLAAISYLEPLVRLHGLRAVLLFPVPSPVPQSNPLDTSVASSRSSSSSLSSSSQLGDNSSTSTTTTSGDTSACSIPEQSRPSENIDTTTEQHQQAHHGDVKHETGDDSGSEHSKDKEHKELIMRATRANGNPVLKLIPLLRRHLPELLVIVDVCLCAFTNTGHCCVFRSIPSAAAMSTHEDNEPEEILERQLSRDQLIDDDDDDEDGNVDDEDMSSTTPSEPEELIDDPDHHEQVIDGPSTRKLISQLALAYARYGAHVVAPSCMMDGHVASIRRELNRKQYDHVSIMAYSAKFASCLYGPFRDAAHSAPSFGDRKAYQLPPGSRALAMRAIERDWRQGADILMVKPATLYLDIVRDVKSKFSNAPVAVYHVSGEYSMLTLAARSNIVDLRTALQETLAAFRRAGASIIITYFTPAILRGDL